MICEDSPRRQQVSSFVALISPPASLNFNPDTDTDTDTDTMPLNHAIYPSLYGKTVLVTGGAEGIGASIVELFCLQGCHVFFLDIATVSAQQTIERVNLLCAKSDSRFGPLTPPTFFQGDVTNLPDLQSAVDNIVKEHGVVNILINNAAAAGAKARLDTDKVTPEDWDFQCNASLRHIFFLTQAVLPTMKAVGSGSIVNMGSITWRIPAAGQPVYGACKAAVMGLTRIQSKETGPWNIRINSVMPGAIATQRQRDEVLTPEYRAEVMRNQSLQRDLEPEDVAKVVIFLASDEANGVTGSTYVVDGGWCSDT
ncbi:hypothetical protein CDV36_015091 [Fusarium kuroshium]|uniref:3-oxoacyl-[acyl-carrier-protein] reductase FabG n=1 Tax=Fusarium kuroshium TaxID=2010991 RepID=A0A3M2RDJ4_9HYPO|nr:hypothetical protein CDV36_015091 [Fusarium kuroshium]